MGDTVHERWLAREGEASRALPPAMRPIDRWTQELQHAPSPCMDAALAKHTAAIRQMHAELGLAEPVLP